MAQYLQKRKSGGYLYRRRVPKNLRHRTDTFPNPHIEEYLGTSDKATAKRKVSAVNEKWERVFDAMRKDETITAEQIEKIRLAAQFQVHAGMMTDPLGGPKAVADAIDAFLPNVEADARKYLERAGLDPSERNMDAATRAILIGTVGAQALYDRGLTPPELPSYEPLAFDTAGPGGPTIIEAADAYEQAADITVTEKTRRQVKQTAKLFADHVGDKKPVAAVTGKDAVAFLDRLAKIDPDYRRDPKSGELSLDELAESYPAKEGRGLSAATINRHAGHMRVLISWLTNRHELPNEHPNAFAGKSRSAKGNPRLPMTDSEIIALLDGTPLVCSFGRNFKECVGWLVLLGAYTGARAGELCTLTSDDVREKDGVHFIAIRTGKTDSAARVIPLHPDLIRMGFLDYAKQCNGDLFGITAKTLAKRFPGYRRDRKVDRAGLAFHSLRKSFVARLEEAEVPSDTAALLVGHTSKRSFTYDVYSPHGPTLKKLSEAVGKVRYIGLTDTTHKTL
jgi:integrase